MQWLDTLAYRTAHAEQIIDFTCQCIVTVTSYVLIFYLVVKRRMFGELPFRVKVNLTCFAIFAPISSVYYAMCLKHTPYDGALILASHYNVTYELLLQTVWVTLQW